MLLLVHEVLGEGGEEFGAVRADDEGCRVFAVAEDELEQFRGQGWGKEEGM